MRRDKILQEFLKHDIVNDKNAKKEHLPTTVSEALNSKDITIKTLALIIDKLEARQVSANAEIYRQVASFLKTSNS